MGMGPDQFVSFYLVIALGIISGTIFSTVTFSKERISWHLVLAVVLVLIACGLDLHLTSDVRPANFYPSQFLVGFASGVFIGPLLLTGFINALQKGPSYVLTFIVLFSATQTFGGLLGNAFFSSYQYMRTQNHRIEIISKLPQNSPLLTQQLAVYQYNATTYTLDPVLQQNQALRSLNQTVNREAQVRAYNDVIALNGIFALLLLLWGSFNILKSQYLLRKQPFSSDTS